MKHKIELLNWNYDDNYGTTIIIDGERLFYDAENTYNCLEEILNKLKVDFEIEYLEEKEVNKIVKQKMKLVPMENDNEKN
jgi:hypothetical protein